MAKNLIIFGAGASYGSDDGPGVHLPSLGSGLFDDLIKFNPPGWGQLDKSHGEMFRKDFEKAMETYAKDFPGNMTRLQRAMAAYFYQFNPRLDNLYQKLAQRIKSNVWNGAIATLNYERLLTLSLISRGLSLKTGELALEKDEVELCFPHGCCTFFCQSVQATDSTIFANCKIDGPVMDVPNNDDFHQRINHEAVPPVMSYFLPSKETMAGISFIDGQRNRLGKLIREADSIAIVGLRLREHDRHIWDPIAETEAKIIYVSGKSAGDEFREWADKIRTTKSNEILPLYFNDAFKKICEFLGL